jgi:hypothetical protein
MYCTRCGANNSSTATFCVQCGNALRETQQQIIDVPNYLAPSILVTLFCCLPFGIVAIVYAAQVNSKLQFHDHAGALEASKKAKNWCWVSFWVGLSVIILYFISIFLVGFLSRA